MSGILGWWNLDGKPIEREVFARMSATMSHRGPDGLGVWVQGAVGLCCQHFKVTPESLAETQPWISSSGSILVWDGRLDNREELLEAVKNCREISPDSPDPAFVSAAYEVWGEDFAEKLNGEFAFAIFDPRRQKLILVRDAIGIKQLYYCQVGNSFLFASEIKALLAHPAVTVQPNDDVVARFALRRYAEDEQGLTFFTGIYSLISAHQMVVTPRGSATRRYWDFDPSRQLRLDSFEAYAEGFKHYFEQAIRRRMRTAYPVVVSLSGGLDSSSIFCQAETIRRQSPNSSQRIVGVSFVAPPGSPAGESEYLEEIERACDVTIERYPVEVPTLFHRIEETVAQVEIPLVCWDSAHRYKQKFQQTGARVLLTGVWGDQVLAQQAYFVDLVRRFAWQKAGAHLREFASWFEDADPHVFRQNFIRDLRTFFTPSWLRPFLRQARARAFPQVGDQLYQHALITRAHQNLPPRTDFRRAFNSAHSASIYAQVRSSKHLNTRAYENKFCSLYQLEPSWPFLDRDLVAYLMSIPGDMQSWQGIPRAIQREALQGILPEAIAKRRNKADFTDLVNCGIKQDYVRLAGYFTKDSLLFKYGYVNTAVFEKKLDELRANVGSLRAFATWRLIDLLGLEVWLQTFWGQGRNVLNTSPQVKETSSSYLMTEYGTKAKALGL